jgi:hypothetical protein
MFLRLYRIKQAAVREKITHKSQQGNTSGHNKLLRVSMKI